MRMLKATTAPIEDLQLIAWHHMINDPHLQVYTVDDGKINRKYFNPKLAWKRSMGELSAGFQVLIDQFQKAFLPSFKEMEEWAKQLNSQLKPIFPEELRVD